MAVSEQSRLDPYIKMTLESGVPPLELSLTEVNEVRSKQILGYRATATINSVLLGTLKERDYENAMSKSPIGNELSLWGLKEVMRMMKSMDNLGRDYEFISFKCPPKFISQPGVYETLKAMTEEIVLEHPEKLVLEFPSKVLLGDMKKTAQSMIDLKLLNFRTLLTGVGSKDCPIHLISEIPTDIVLLDPLVTRQAEDPEKIKFAKSLVQYLNTMDLQVVMSDVRDDKTIDAFMDMNGYAFIPSRFYVGLAPHSIRSLKPEDIIDRL